MNEAVIQQIQHVDGDTYQALFQNVVTACGVVIVGLNVTKETIQRDDIRVGDTVQIGKNDDGLYISGCNVGARAPTSSRFFPPEPPPKVSNLVMSVGPFDANKCSVDLQKTLTLTVRGVLTNAGVPNAGMVCVAMGESSEIADVAECVSNLATESA